MHSVVDKVKASMEQASTKTPFDTFMEEKVMNKPYLDKFQHLKEKKVRFSDDDYFNLLNKRNKDVILRKSNFVTVAGRDQHTADVLKSLGSCTAVFSITEPDLSTFVPAVSPLKMGTITDVTESAVCIQLREDFLPSSEEDEMLLEAVVQYKGSGKYEVMLDDFVTLMVEVPEGKEAAFKQLKGDKEKVFNEFAAN
jgi:hypothetical protein